MNMLGAPTSSGTVRRGLWAAVVSRLWFEWKYEERDSLLGVNGKSQEQYVKYKALADTIPILILCDRLVDFMYYNMYQTLDRALGICIIGLG